ncbi:MAG: hypothetical protein GXO26_00960 [Crenarchaeota archaeon]|nr:hypothetical protein [Thermoproteota archaeon]
MLKNLKYISVVLERGRCSWGRCYFCGWGNRYVNSSITSLTNKFKHVISKRKDEEVLKIFCSGSFLDERQFPRDFVYWCLAQAEKAGFKHVVIESRPEFIREEVLQELTVFNIKIHVAIGLEIADDHVLNEYYRKGMKFIDYLRAVKLLHDKGFYVRTYVLVNGHPILYNNPTYHKTLIRETLDKVNDLSDSIVVINAYPHSSSLLFKDWLIMRWRPLSYEEFINIVGEYVNDSKIEIDFNNFNFIPRFPRELRIKIEGVGCDIVKHPYFEIWQDYIQRFYKVPPDKEYVLFLPCTYVKPYRRSITHRKILSVIFRTGVYKKIQLVVVSTPGVIPYEYHDMYPFESYDWPEWLETPEIMKCYIEVTKNRVKRFIENCCRNVKLFIAYFHKNSETLQAIREAVEELGLKDKFIEVIDDETFKEIVRDLGTGKKLGSSILRHDKALKKLEEVLIKCVSSS